MALAALALALPAAPAAAGAWTREPGEGQLLVASGRETAPIAAVVSGTPEDDKTFVSLYLDYGLREGLTIGAFAYGDLSTTDLTDGQASAGLFVRQRIWTHPKGHVASIQVSGAAPIERLISEEFAASKPDSTVEFQFRGLYGKSWWGDWGSAFVSLEAGYALRSENAADEIRADATIGYKPWRCCLAFVGLFSQTPIKGDEDASLKIAPSLAYTPWPDFDDNDKKPARVLVSTLQFGFSYDVLDPDGGLGITVGIWRPF